VTAGAELIVAADAPGPAGLTRQEPVPRRSPWRRVVIAFLALAILAAFALRLVISWYSLGSNDWDAWAHFGYWIGQYGLFPMYKADPHLNHPPLAALWAAKAMRLSQVTGLSFPFLFRLPAIAADAGSCLLIGLVMAKRRGAVWGWLLAAGFAWCLPAILVGAYHCNTDNVGAFLILLSVWLLAERASFLGGGLALAAAINVKLIPVLLVPPLLSLSRDRRDALRFLGGLAVGALPFIPVLIGAGGAFYRNALAYNPMVDQWGPALFLQAFEEWQFPQRWPEWHQWIERHRVDWLNWYHAHARHVILALVTRLAAASAVRRRRRGGRAASWDGYELAAITCALFLVLTGGFGVQYLVYVAPLLFIVRPRAAVAYSLLAGLFLLVIYTQWWTGTVPMYSAFGGPARMPAPLFGLLAWAVLVSFIAQLIARPSRGAA
jgi:hypothetical protein